MAEGHHAGRREVGGQIASSRSLSVGPVAVQVVLWLALWLDACPAKEPPMDIKTGTEFAAMWSALSHELHVASGDWNAEVQRRVETEFAPINLSKADWSGAAPYTHFGDPKIPSHFTHPGDDVLVQRVLFKVEAWSAPALGGIARAFFSGDQKGWIRLRNSSLTSRRLMAERDSSRCTPPARGAKRRCSGRTAAPATGSVARVWPAPMA